MAMEHSGSLCLAHALLGSNTLVDFHLHLTCGFHNSSAQDLSLDAELILLGQTAVTGSQALNRCLVS